MAIKKINEFSLPNGTVSYLRLARMMKFDPCKEGIAAYKALLRKQKRKLSLLITATDMLHWSVLPGIKEYIAWAQHKGLLHYANFNGASLDGASLRNASLDGASLDGASRNSYDPPIPGWKLVNGLLCRA